MFFSWEHYNVGEVCLDPKYIGGTPYSPNVSTVWILKGIFLLPMSRIQPDVQKTRSVGNALLKVLPALSLYIFIFPSGFYYINFQLIKSVVQSVGQAQRQQRQTGRRCVPATRCIGRSTATIGDVTAHLRCQPSAFDLLTRSLKHLSNALLGPSISFQLSLEQCVQNYPRKFLYFMTSEVQQFDMYTRTKMFYV